MDRNFKYQNKPIENSVQSSSLNSCISHPCFHQHSSQPKQPIQKQVSNSSSFFSDISREASPLNCGSESEEPYSYRLRNQTESSFFADSSSQTSAVFSLNRENTIPLHHKSAEQKQEKPDLHNQAAYLFALKKAYDAIFEADLKHSIVKCIHGRETTEIGGLYDIHMTVESAQQFWLTHHILEEDRERMSDFFTHLTTMPLDWDQKTAIQTEFGMHWNGRVYRMFLLGITLTDSKILLCLRDTRKYNGTYHSERRRLNHLCSWMDVLFQPERYNISLMICEKYGDYFTPLYISPTFLDRLEADEMNALMLLNREMTKKELILNLNLLKPDFEKLLETGHIGLQPRKSSCNIELECRSYVQGDRTLYVIRIMKADQEEDKAENPAVAKAKPKRIFARTFGHFDLFVDDVPITFSNHKEKELLALLIDRNGGTVSGQQAISYLWEDEPADSKLAGRYRKLAMGLKKTLEKYGAEAIINNQNGVRSINKANLICDYYEMLSGNDRFTSTFNNAYMTDYSWAEETLSSLWNYADPFDE